MSQKNYQNYIIMLNLQELALSATEANVVKSTKKENVNDAIVRILFDGKKSLTRVQLISAISLDRLVVEHTEAGLQKLTEAEFKALIKVTNKTVKNGVDTSVSDSNNNSSFSYNAKYAHLKLIKTGNELSVVAAK